MTQSKGVIPQSAFIEETGQKVVLALSGTENFIAVERGDFVISLRSFEGGIEHSKYSGCVSPAYTVMRAQRPIIAAFWAYLLKSSTFVGALQSTTVGIRDGKTISYDQFGSLPLPEPPLEDQRRIGAFLDRETAKIDALIAEQERLIALLQEKRQAVISHAVTKGLDPNVPMKDSMIAWIGRVPGHWQVTRCSRHLTIIPGFAFPAADFSEDEADTKLLRGINVGVSSIRWDDVVYWMRTEDDGLDRYELKEGDVVLGMDRPVIGAGVRIATISASDLPCLLLQRVALLRPDESLDGQFLRNVLSTSMFAAHFLPETTGVSVPHISPDQISSFVLALPPKEEQIRIVDLIDQETSRMSATVTEAEAALALLRERRAALITAAVTGQIDVRGLVETAA